MKRKYQGLVSICLLLIALIASVVYAVSASWETGDDLHVTRDLHPTDVTVPGPSVIKEMKTAGRKMAGLINPPDSVHQPANLVLFGYPPDMSRRSELSESVSYSTVKNPMDYSVSLAFTSGKRRFCIIDGSFYTEQSDLPQAGKVLKIESKRVLVGKDGISKWVSVDGSAAFDDAGKKKRALAQNSKKR